VGVLAYHFFVSFGWRDPSFSSDAARVVSVRRDGAYEPPEDVISKDGFVRSRPPWNGDEIHSRGDERVRLSLASFGRMNCVPSSWSTGPPPLTDFSRQRGGFIHVSMSRHFDIPSPAPSNAGYRGSLWVLNGNVLPVTLKFNVDDNMRPSVHPLYTFRKLQFGGRLRTLVASGFHLRSEELDSMCDMRATGTNRPDTCHRTASLRWLTIS